MSNRPWLAHYPADVPHELTGLEVSTLPELLTRAVEKYGKTTAFTQVMPNGMNGSITFDQLDTLSDQFAGYLRDTLGLGFGDRVAVQMPNCLSYPIVAFGIFKAGCVLVNTNPLYTPKEMVHQFADSGAKALVIIDMFADRLPEVLGKTKLEHVITVKISEFFPGPVDAVIRGVQKYWSRSIPKITVQHTRFRDALDSGKATTKSKVAGFTSSLTSDSLAALQYTGGTTGVSKGAMLTHGNLVTNTLQMISMCGSYIRPGKEIVLTALPLYHIFAFTVNLLGFLHMGARNILIPSPRPPGNLQRAFENYKITWLTGVNTLFNALLNERWFAESPPKHLVASAAGGMALHASVSDKWREVTNTPIVEGYGLTETSPVVTFNPLGGMQKDGTIGIPVPSTEVRLVDATGAAVGVGEPGELQVRGPQVTRGYWTGEYHEGTVDSATWFSTGDVATMDEDGYFTIVDRKKDMVNVSGFNVYPNEVEECIAAMDGVLEVGVVGLPDEKSGERVAAFVVVSDTKLTVDAVLEHCRKSLAAYKVPAKVAFVEQLPKSPIGKILRRELRREMTESQSSERGN